MLFTEDFLYYVWKFRLYERANLLTTNGEVIEVVNAGMQNTNSGPDFQHARIKIGDTVWAGNVEIHVAASDWQRHNHQQDRAYDNVILHVVYRDDVPVKRIDGNDVPTLELENRIPPELYAKYHNLVYGEQKFIPCESAIHTVDNLTMQSWLTRVLVERMEKKSAIVITSLAQNRGDWEETFYQCLAANFGFKVNALPFEMLAKSLPQSILGKHKNNPMQIEALIFGQSGFLSGEMQDVYPDQLKTEYQFMQKKYSLKPLDVYLWKFMRMRPLNFPTVRLAQFAALVIKSNHLLSKILEIREIPELRKLFAEIEVNPYWETHYRFSTEAKPVSKKMGETSINNLLLNTLALFLFTYGKQHNQNYYISRSLKLLEQLPAEQNAIIIDFDVLGVKAKTAFESQALLALKNNYCNYKKCLHCSVGNKLLKLA